MPSVFPVPSAPSTIPSWRDLRLPAGRLYVFGYGSLIWRPGFQHLWSRPARAFGWRRDLCLISTHYRGTPDTPGLVCGLDNGGSCLGFVFCVATENRERVIRYLWKREMITDAYRPIVARCDLLEQKKTDSKPRRNGKSVRALTFVVRHDHPQYGGNLSQAQRLKMLQQGQGSGGTSRDYLERTCASLDGVGVRCPRLHGWLEQLNQQSPKRKI